MKLKYSDVIQEYPKLAHLEADIVQATDWIEQSFRTDGKLITMGNGGSSADAEHFCGELQKGFLLKRPLSEQDKKLFKDINPQIPLELQGGLPAISLGTMHSSISAFSNDCNPEYVFAQQLWALANKVDVVFGISTSGNSKNVVHGLNCAKAKGVKTIALTGEKDSACSEIADLTIRAPHHITHKIQEFHLPIYHALCIELEGRFFTE